MMWKEHYFLYSGVTPTYLFVHSVHTGQAWRLRHHSYLLKLIYCSFMELNSSLLTLP